LHVRGNFSVYNCSDAMAYGEDLKIEDIDNIRMILRRIDEGCTRRHSSPPHGSNGGVPRYLYETNPEMHMSEQMFHMYVTEGIAGDILRRKRLDHLIQIGAEEHTVKANTIELETATLLQVAFPGHTIRSIPVRGDGDCFFGSLSIIGSPYSLRYLCAGYMKDHLKWDPDLSQSKPPSCTDRLPIDIVRDLLCIDENGKALGKFGFCNWGDSSNIAALVHMRKICIIVVVPDTSKSGPDGWAALTYHMYYNNPGTGGNAVPGHEFTLNPDDVRRRMQIENGNYLVIGYYDNNHFSTFTGFND